MSHVDIVLPNDDLLGARSDRVGHRPAGVEVRPAGYVPWSRRVVIELASDATQNAKFYKFLGEQIGKPYDKTAIFAFVWNRDWRERDSWFCSELAAAALEAAGLIHHIFNDVNKVTPSALADILTAMGGVVILEEPPKPAKPVL